VIAGGIPACTTVEGVQIAQRGRLSSPTRSLPMCRRTWATWSSPWVTRAACAGSWGSSSSIRRGPRRGPVPHLYPVSLAVGYGVDGLTGVRRVTGLWAMLGVLAVYFAGTIYFGRPAAAAAAGLFEPARRAGLVRTVAEFRGGLPGVALRGAAGARPHGDHRGPFLRPGGRQPARHPVVSPCRCDDRARDGRGGNSPERCRRTSNPGDVRRAAPGVGRRRGRRTSGSSSGRTWISPSASSTTSGPSIGCWPTRACHGSRGDCPGATTPRGATPWVPRGMVVVMVAAALYAYFFREPAGDWRRTTPTPSGPSRHTT